MKMDGRGSQDRKLNLLSQVLSCQRRSAAALPPIGVKWCQALRSPSMRGQADVFDKSDLSRLGASEKLRSLHERALVSRCIEGEWANSVVGIEQNLVFVSVFVAECFPLNCFALSLYHRGYRAAP